MKQVIPERLDCGSGAIVGARTLRGSATDCLLMGNEIRIGIVDVWTKDRRVSIRVGADRKDYQHARVYDDEKLVG
jgi:hypothetical protein